MSIRTKLLLSIVTIVTLLNSVAYFLFQGTQSVLEQHNQLSNQLLLCNQLPQQVNANLNTLNQYMVDQTIDTRSRFDQQQNELEQSLANLKQQTPRADTYITLSNCINLIQTFRNKEDQILASIEQHRVTEYSQEYSDLETVGSYISSTAQSLLNLELTHYQQSYQEIVQKNQELKTIGVSIFIVSTILSVLIALSVAGGITEPLKRLMKSAHRLSSGDLQGEEIEVQTLDEVGALAKMFNQMQRNIQQLVGKIREQAEIDRHMKDVELKALQSQINPHFLFNSLNSIAKLAYMEGAERSGDLIGSISALLRYNLRKMNRPVTLREELENVNEYLTIQKVRFRDRFELHMEVDDTVLDTLVPCLILQPIVENAFVHGVEEMVSGAILRVGIHKDGDGVSIVVQDNGKGMPPDRKERLTERLLGLGDDDDDFTPKSKSSGIGMTNVGKRLALFYDATHRVHIESSPGQGTMIRLWIPYKKEEIQ
jgi:sensor histidine kinase YesM